jgi:hypothetical protein
MSGLEKTYRKTLSTFLQTDIRGLLTFRMEKHRHSETCNYVSSIFLEDIAKSEKAKFFDQFLAIPSDKSSDMISFIKKKANKAMVVPLSVFTNLLHQRYPKHRYLESTLELLQQFYIAIEESDDTYNIFPGDQYLVSLKCMRCHNTCVSARNQGIAATLLKAPTAILTHYYFIRTHDDDFDITPMSLPVMFSCDGSYHVSKEAFEKSLDWDDDVLVFPSFCIQNTRHGNLNFVRR